MKESDWKDWKDWKDYSSGKIDYENVKSKIPFDYWINGVLDGEINWDWFLQFLNNKEDYKPTKEDFILFEYYKYTNFIKPKKEIRSQLKALKTLHPFLYIQYPQIKDLIVALESTLETEGDTNYLKMWCFLFKEMTLRYDKNIPTMERSVIVAEMLLNHHAGQFITVSLDDIQAAKQHPLARKEIYDKIKKYWK